MEFLDPKLDDYVVRNTDPEPQVLQDLNRETYSKILYPRMLAGHYQGRVLSMLSHMIQPKRVLEIGTYTGYSALCWAEGLQDGGVVDTVEINEELETMIKKFWEASEQAHQIRLHIGHALDLIPQLDGNFDLVYIDADKENYPHYFDHVIDRVNKGGYIIADNVLWSGKVIEDQPDHETQSLMDYAQKVHDDPRVSNVLLPVRDGLLVARKTI
ncbi:MAG: O-methyltransferase [Salibacteraceae bacterium]